MNILELKTASDLFDKLNQAIWASNRLTELHCVNVVVYHGYKFIEKTDAKGKVTKEQVTDSFTIHNPDSSRQTEYLVGHYADVIEAVSLELEFLGVSKDSIDEYINTNTTE